MKTKTILLALVVTAGLIYSCSSDESITDNTPLSTNDVNKETQIDAAIDDVSIMAEDQYAILQTSMTSRSTIETKGNLPTCATVTTVVTTDSYTRTVDFGTDGCTLENGNTIKGKIIFSFSKDFTTATKTVSFTFEDGSVYTRKGSRVRELIEGYDTPLIFSDNVFIVTGSHTTTKRNGTTISSTINTPLRFESSCKSPFPVSGTITLTKNDNTAVIDYGDGTCDKTATFALNGEAAVSFTLTK